ncbi:MAG: hypothetical protein HY422_02285 [Candidatus Komeilibacteria bacterium]|nr:hypothetical protein [Candidatus Komeilibacteria bacterium]
MVDDLVELGLGRTEALVFQTIVEKGPCFVAPIVYTLRKHRQIVYNALESLLVKKLISVSQKNGKNFYAMGDPSRMLIELEQKRVVAEKVVERIEGHLKKEQEQVEFFSGSKSYERGLFSFRSHAEAAQEYIVVGGEPREWFLHTRGFFQEHVSEVKKLKEKGIPILILFYEREQRSATEFIRPYLHDPYECRVAKDELRWPHTVWIAGEHIYLLTPVVDPLVVHIKSKALAEDHRENFWSQWKNAKLL